MSLSIRQIKRTSSIAVRKTAGQMLARFSIKRMGYADMAISAAWTDPGATERLSLIEVRYDMPCGLTLRGNGLCIELLKASLGGATRSSAKSYGTEMGFGGARSLATAKPLVLGKTSGLVLN